MPCLHRATPFALLAAALTQPVAAAPRVVSDIAPVHSIVSRVMEGAGVPELLMPPGASPHGHAMRPSEAARLEDADVVFWVGPALTPWLDGPIDALATGAVLVTIAEAPGILRLPIRTGGPFEAHAHDEHAHDDHGHTHVDHSLDAFDAHLWLDPVNAAAIAAVAAETLGAADPANAALYASNAAAFAMELEALRADIDARLAPLRGRAFVVFHDAYQYFESRFDFAAAGSISLGDADAPSPARVAAIRDRIATEGVVCVFAEPQFEPRLVATVIEGSEARSGVLDPVGTGLEPGPGLYPALLTGLARGLADCLGG
jgi:zinc transport system substrate-binding protein